MSKLLNIVITFLLLLIFTPLVHGQEEAKSAQLNDDHGIFLYTGYETQSVFKADISQFNWVDKSSAEAELQDWNRENIKLTLDFEERTVTIELLKNSDNSHWSNHDWRKELMKSKK
jgi:hypothetical protein